MVLDLKIIGKCCSLTSGLTLTRMRVSSLGMDRTLFCTSCSVTCIRFVSAQEVPSLTVRVSTQEDVLWKLLTSISWQFSSSLSSGLSPYIVTQSCSLISARLILLIVMRVVFLITVMAMMCCLASLAEWLWMVYWACCLVKRISEMIVPSQTDVRCQGGQKMIPTQS